MCAAVHDVHHGDGQHLGVRATEVLVERLAERAGGGVCGGKRNAEDGVGSELRLGLGPVELEHGVVDADLIGRIGADEGGGDDPLHIADCGEDALAEVALLAIDALGQRLGRKGAVAELERFVLARGGAGRHGGAAERAVGETDVDLDGRIAARVDDFTGGDGGDGGVHGGGKGMDTSVE